MGEEAESFFNSTRKEILEEIEKFSRIILDLDERTALIGLLQRIVEIVSGVEAAHSYTHSYLIFDVKLPDIETLGVFFRELEHLKLRRPNEKLAYSGKIDGDKVLAHVEVRFTEGEAA